jgi:hypothetical protein
MYYMRNSSEKLSTHTVNTFINIKRFNWATRLLRKDTGINCVEDTQSCIFGFHKTKEFPDQVNNCNCSVGALYNGVSHIIPTEIISLEMLEKFGSMIKSGLMIQLHLCPNALNSCFNERYHVKTGLKQSFSH